MIEKATRVLKQIVLHNTYLKGRPTIGQVTARMKMSKSTVRRVLLFAETNGLVTQELVGYKSTGKRVFEITEKGFDFLLEQKELF